MLWRHNINELIKKFIFELKPDSSAGSKSFLVNFFNVFGIVIVVTPELPPESGRLRDLDDDENV